MSLYCEASTPMLKLDGKNYEQWRIAFDLWLDNNNRRRTIYNAGNETSDDITQEDINTLKGQLLAFMLPFDIFKLVKRKANAKEIINELERLYNKRKNEYAAELAMDELTKLRHTQLGNLNQFIIDFKTQLVNCEDNGSNFSDEKKIEYFIRSMPTELDYATTNVQISGLSIFEDVLDLMRFADSLQFRRQKEDSSLGEINRVLPANSNQPCQHRDDHQNQDNRRSPERYSRRPSRSRSRSREHSRESLCSRYDYYDDYPRCRSRERSWESSCGSRHEYDYDDRSRSANRRGYYSRY